MKNTLRKLSDYSGVASVTMAEYVVIAVVMILVAIVAFTDLGTTILTKINELIAGM